MFAVLVVQSKPSSHKTSLSFEAVSPLQVFVPFVRVELPGGGQKIGGDGRSGGGVRSKGGLQAV